MKLVISTDQGEVIEVIEGIDQYDLTSGLARAEILNTIERAVDRGRHLVCDGCGSGLNTVVEFPSGWFCQDCADRKGLDY